MIVTPLTFTLMFMRYAVGALIDYHRQRLPPRHAATLFFADEAARDAALRLRYAMIFSRSADMLPRAAFADA